MGVSVKKKHLHTGRSLWRVFFPLIIYAAKAAKELKNETLKFHFELLSGIVCATGGGGKGV